MTSICYISIQDDKSDLHVCDHIYIEYNNEFAKIMEWSTNTI